MDGDLIESFLDLEVAVQQETIQGLQVRLDFATLFEDVLTRIE